MFTPELNTLFIARNLILLEEVDSTNKYAHDFLLQTKNAEGTVILAYNQVQGKGQRNNTWESEPFKNLTFSIVLKPTFLEISQSFLLSKAIALGLWDFLSEILGLEVKIKWPNDIYVGHKKISGILIENTLRGNKINQSIVGIGLNINQIDFHSLLTATSLTLETGLDHDLATCFSKLCSSLERRYVQLKNNKTEQINKEYFDALFGLNKMLKFNTETESFEAEIQDVSNDGKLVLKTNTGILKGFYFKEISLEI